MANRQKCRIYKCHRSIKTLRKLYFRFEWQFTMWTSKENGLKIWYTIEEHFITFLMVVIREHLVHYFSCGKGIYDMSLCGLSPSVSLFTNISFIFEAKMCNCVCISILSNLDVTELFSYLSTFEWKFSQIGNFEKKLQPNILDSLKWIQAGDTMPVCPLENT